MIEYKSVTNCSRYAIKVDGYKCIPKIVAYGMICTFCYEHKEKRINFKWLLWDVENPTNEELENVKRHVESLFKDKESEKCMITDKQGREWLLQKLYDEGWRYLYGDYYGTTCLADKEPKTDKFGSIIPGGDHRSTGLTKPFFSELKINQILNIAEELGIVDWSKVAVDTPILVRNFNITQWKKRYFAFYKDGKVYAWNGGSTSWSCEHNNDVSSWDYAKLAEV